MDCLILDVGSLSSLTSCSEGFFMKSCFAFHLDTMDLWSWTFDCFSSSAHLAYGRNACSLLQFSSMLGETCGRASMEFEWLRVRIGLTVRWLWPFFPFLTWFWLGWLLLSLSNRHVSSGSSVDVLMCCNLGQAIEVERCGFHLRIVQTFPMHVPVFGLFAWWTLFRMSYFVDKCIP